MRNLKKLNDWLSPGVELTDREIEFVLAVFETFRTRLPLPTRLDDASLASITAPTLVLLAEQTVLYDVPKAAARGLRQLLADVDVEIVPGAGHGLPFQLPELTCDHVLRHVEAHPVGPEADPALSRPPNSPASTSRGARRRAGPASPRGRYGLDPWWMSPAC